MIMSNCVKSKTVEEKAHFTGTFWPTWHFQAYKWFDEMLKVPAKRFF